MGAKKMVSDALEKILGRFYEGPRTPARFVEAPRAFGHARPSATREEWEDEACRIADDAYRAGYMRGLEAAQRAASAIRPALQDASEAALRAFEEQRQDWPWRANPRGASADDPLRGVPEEMRAQFMQDLARAQDVGYQIVTVRD